MKSEAACKQQERGAPPQVPLRAAAQLLLGRLPALLAPVGGFEGMLLWWLLAQHGVLHRPRSSGAAAGLRQRKSLPEHLHNRAAQQGCYGRQASYHT